MTKKHYIIAARIVAAYDNRTHAALVAAAYVRLFKASGGNFGEGRFLTACGF